MKIRNGFVSNSSSSSFIVAFPKRPNSVEETRQIMFGDLEIHYGYQTKHIAEKIYEEILLQEDTRDTDGNLIEFNETVLACIEVQGDTDLILSKFFKDVNEEIKWKLYERIDKMKDTNSCSEFSDFIKANSESVIYNFQFSDEGSSFWSMMEHSGVFAKLNHIEESHH